jgi:hypothetical protein
MLTKSFVGTPEYLGKIKIIKIKAPELILNQEYGRCADYWAFGLIMYNCFK